ncbi:MAG: nitronate monooxygenase [Acidimicrobiia bacterium]|nr:nitronate monooxygenase [Acidimicrobiia bacterium]
MRGEGYRTVPTLAMESPVVLRELTVLANFAEVWLAKEGHDGPIGVNYLEKVQLPTPFAVYGALLAGVDYVLMGAGIPADLPRMISSLALGEPVAYRLSVEGAEAGDDFSVRLDPSDLLGSRAPRLARPRFLAIVASNTLASFLAKDPATRPDGFVVEGETAGGHNAPPRGPLHLDDRGEPVYGLRDRVDLDRMAAIGLPFWLAGGFAEPQRLREAIDSGAAGVQVGSAFALCEESGFLPEYKRAIIDAALSGEVDVFTDPVASPSGYPFKVVRLPGTMSESTVYEDRRRVCDLGFLRSAFKQEDGSVGYRCASEPVTAFVRKGGRREETVGRKCLCNALLAASGYGQVRGTGVEPALVTGGDDIVRVARSLAGATGTWTAADVVAYLLGTDASSPTLM